MWNGSGKVQESQAVAADLRTQSGRLTDQVYAGRADLSGDVGPPGSATAKATGPDAFRGGRFQEGVRVCRQRHDARTASEHLAPFPVLKQDLAPLDTDIFEKTKAGLVCRKHPSPALNVS